jgi:cell division protein FtsX
MHAEREPWLPLREAFPDLPRPLWRLTVAVVSVVAALLFVLLMLLMF